MTKRELLINELKTLIDVIENSDDYDQVNKDVVDNLYRTIDQIGRLYLPHYLDKQINEGKKNDERT